MPIQVFTKVQDPTQESAAHKSGVNLAGLVVVARHGRWLTPRSIQLTTNMSWATVKQIIKGNYASATTFPTSSLRPPDATPRSLDLGYPHVDQCTNPRKFGSVQNWDLFPLRSM